MAKTSQPPADHAAPAWQVVHEYEDITFRKAEGIGRIAINRPEVHNAFRPQTVKELIDAFSKAREDEEIGVVILAGEGGRAFCSGGDQRVRGDQGYVGNDGVPRLNVLDLQKLIRSIPKPVVAMVAGWAIGGGHVLHVVCDLTIAADNARFGQTGPRVEVPALLIAGSLDAKFVQIARDLEQRLPHAHLQVVEGAGHNVHLEKPEEFVALVDAFLRHHDGHAAH